METLADVGSLVLIGAPAPVSFFAYQQLPSDLVPADCEVVRLAHRHEDGAGALAALADALSARAAPALERVPRPEVPSGGLSVRGASTVLAAMVPENCVVTLDSGGGAAVLPQLQRSVPHSCLHLTGGAIGQGGPAAVGAALACPERTVFALIGDGGAMYTNQFLWTAAREQLRVVTVIYCNRKYGILDTEYRRLGINDVGERAASLFDLSRPDIDWVAMARAQGVPGRRADTCEAFAAALGDALSSDGPYLIEASV
jgi:acetolactate synthase-1/2/3 large subunit